MDVTLSPDRLRRWLFRAVAVVATLGVLSELAYNEFDFESGEYLMEVFSLSMEHNFPTWFSAALHSLSAGLLVLAALCAAQGGTRYVRHWAVLAVFFAYISLDETVTIHEKLNRLVDLGDLEELGGGLLYFTWIVPAAGVLLVLGVSYAGFLLHLPPRTRRDVLLAGSVFVGGAVLMELPLGVWSEAHGVDNLGYALIDAVEETLEMLGMSLFVAALVRHLLSHEHGLRLALAQGATRAPREESAVLPPTPRPIAAELNAWAAPSPPPELEVARPRLLSRPAEPVDASAAEALAARVVAASLGGIPRSRATPPPSA